MKTVILGAGPSGLGIAWGLVEAGKKDILVIEKNQQLGGLSGSFDWEGITLDYGPHRFSPEFPKLTEKVGSLLGKDWLEVENDHAIVFGNRLYHYPPEVKDFLNFYTIQLGTRVVSSWLWQQFKRPFAPRMAQPTFENHIIDTFGETFYKVLVEPVCHKIWGSPKSLDPTFAKVRFSLPSFGQVFKKLLSRSNEFNDKTFYYPTKGFQQLWDKIGEHLKKNGVDIRTETQATKIRLENRRVRSIQLNEKGTYHEYPVDWLASTIPAETLMGLMTPSPLPASQKLASRFHTKGILLISLLINRPRTLPARVVIVPESKYCFNRLCEQNLFSRKTVPNSAQSVIIADIITDITSEMWKTDDTTITEKVIGDILKCRLVKRDEIVKTSVFRHRTAYPLPTIERESAQLQLNRRLSQLDNIICSGRFATSDYNNSHTALQKGFLAAKVIAGSMTKEDWYFEGERIRQLAIRD